jgi:hypothetical protein
MKGCNRALVIFLLCSCLTGCGIKSTDLPITRKKPNNYYYTNLAAQSLIKNNEVKVSIMEMNLLKEKPLPKEGNENLIGFFKTLRSQSFISKPADLPSKPQFKIFITGRNEKYVINVFNDKYVSIFPWDGVYTMDYIDMTNVNVLYNLNGLCKYFFK